MQVILLATDEDTKLRPLTDTIPAPLMPIVNRPVIGIAMELLARSSIKEVTVSLAHRSGAVAAYLGDGGRWGVTVKYAIQRESLGDAGAIRWAADHLNETVLVLPADAVLDLDIEKAVDYHRTHGGPATLILHEPAGGITSHPVRVGGDGKVLPAHDSSRESQPLSLTGAYIFDPEVVRQIPAHTEYDVLTQLVPELVRRGHAYGYVAEEYWNPLRTFAAYQEAQRVFLHSAYTPPVGEHDSYRPPHPKIRYASIDGLQIAPGIWVGHDHAIHPHARLAAPVCIGAGCRIGRGVELGPDTVIGSHVVVDDDVTIARSVVLGETYIGRLVNIESRTVYQTTLVDTCSGQATEVVDPFLLAALPLTPGFDGVRRALSVFAAILLFVLTLPITAILALLVGVTSGPRIIVREVRVGRRPARRRGVAAGGSDRFNLLSFRTRRADGSFTLLGRWLEHFGILSAATWIWLASSRSYRTRRHLWWRAGSNGVTSVPPGL
jgi:NDP-sugar pyrophosphorylase family protein